MWEARLAEDSTVVEQWLFAEGYLRVRLIKLLGYLFNEMVLFSSGNGGSPWDTQASFILSIHPLRDKRASKTKNGEEEGLAHPDVVGAVQATIR